MKLIATLRALDETRGAVRIEDVYDTGIDDLWEACTQPERLARWIAEVSGDLRIGGEFDAAFTSGWEGSGRVDACEPPRRLVVSTWETGSTDVGVIEVTLTPDGGKTILVIEDRGVPVAQIAEHGAGWQVHAEDLAAHVAGGERCDMKTRWNALIAPYREAPVG
ncbi:MAG: SRPBCC family protein [Nocardioides sp.]|uniref:SRPBCC family protein n=1 Tax=Nocardioides sp. TaxID=35761 RepID=UPI003265BEEA